MLAKENSKHAGHSLKSDWPNLSHYVSFAELSKQAWLQSLHYMGRRRCLTLIGFNKMLLPQFWPVFKFITKMSQKPFQVYPTCTTLVRIKAKPFCPGRLMWLPLMLMAPSWGRGITGRKHANPLLPIPIIACCHTFLWQHRKALTPLRQPTHS